MFVVALTRKPGEGLFGEAENQYPRSKDLEKMLPFRLPGNRAKAKDVKVANGLKQHIVYGEYIPGKSREAVYYQVPAMDKAGKIIPGVYKNRVYTKTLYDPAIISNEQFYQWGIEAAVNANASKSGKNKGDGYSDNGVHFIWYVNESGEITSFYIN